MIGRRLLVAVPAAGILLAAGCGRGGDAGLIVASGHVEATDVRVSTKIGGRLRSLAPQEGDLVKSGQEIARIDPTDIDLLLRQARAERDQADADVRLRLAGTRAEDIAEQAARVAGARADLEAAERDLTRMQGLLDRGSGTAKARDDARVRRDIAAAQQQAMGEALKRMKAGSRPQEIDAARARLAGAEARIAQLEQQVDDATVRSPVDGVVTQKVAEAGELLGAGTLLLVVTDLADAWLNVYVGEQDLGRIRIGQEAEVATDDGRTAKGRVKYISSEAEFTPKNVQTRDERVKLVYKVKIGLDNREGVFKPGMPAEARLRAAGGA